jgi:hypothetical protein
VSNKEQGMRRIAILAGLLVLIGLAGACGTSASSPSVRVEPGKQYQLVQGAVQLFTLDPTGDPTCVIALKSVKNGRVKKLGATLEKTLTSAGSIAVVSDARGVEVSCLLPPVGVAFGAAFAKDSVESGTTWGTATVEPETQSGEQVVWNQSRFSDHGTHSDTMDAGALDDLVSMSVQYPTRTSYVVTVTVDEGR